MKDLIFLKKKLKKPTTTKPEGKKQKKNNLQNIWQWVDNLNIQILCQYIKNK